MIFINTFSSKLKGKKGHNYFKMALCVFFIFIFTINAFYLDYNIKQGYNDSTDDFYPDFDITDETNLNIAAGPEIFVDPFIINFSKIWNFFRTNYQSDLDMNKDMELLILI